MRTGNERMPIVAGRVMPVVAGSVMECVDVAFEGFCRGECSLAGAAIELLIRMSAGMRVGSILLP